MENWKNDRLEASIKEGTEKIRKEAEERFNKAKEVSESIKIILNDRISSLESDLKNIKIDKNINSKIKEEIDRFLSKINEIIK